ncbi:hypothetical protein BKA59DRAFT_550073 [Fusarium tricinctum]|uniref:Uncharacterized protein n=1 Tax=Fusarium tricinctum TaxID=61284 RepID=A0A8K0S6D2_9HYPO|nr:hypothetical protein BKA59DRAFT_550073 [Fusarium tricinctum]
MAAIARSIASQLRFGSGESSVEAVLEKLRAGKYLVVFDSAEDLDADDSIAHDSIHSYYSKDLRSYLPDFIDEATKLNDGSIVIIASRLDTTSIARVSSHHKYLLSGLSVISSVRLLQELAFKPGEEIPHALERRENIDMLRRAAILVEGNPVALRLLISELRLVNYDCEALFTNLLYGVCTTLQWPHLSGGSRFERSLSLTYRLKPYFISKLAPFWNIMPKDLTMYHCFWHWFGEFDPEPETWLSEAFWRQHSLEFQVMSWQWRDVERSLIQCGILGHATVGKTNGNMACYHVHPVFTLLSRAWLSEQQWGRARFAFVRAARLWYSQDRSPPTPDWTHVVWGSCRQHEDHLYNWRVMALAWCVQDGNTLAEILCERRPLFSIIYQLGGGIIPVTPRYSRLLVPHLRSYLSELYAVTGNLRSTQVLTEYILSAILTFSYDLWKIESDVLNLPHGPRTSTIERALAIVKRWKANPSNRSSLVPPSVQLVYQQLLYAAAVTAQEGGDIKLAKTLYERHLATDPAPSIIGHAVELQLIRSWQYYSLQGWVTCVNMTAMRSSGCPRPMREATRLMLDSLGLGTEKAIPGGFIESLLGTLAQLNGEDLALGAKITPRVMFAFALQREPDAVRRFGKVAKALLDEPLGRFIGEMMQISRVGFAALQSDNGQGSNASSSGQTAEELGIKDVASWLAETSTKAKKSQKAAPKVWKKQQDSYLAQYDATIRMLSGDTAGAEAAIQSELSKEALSSTTSTGAEQLANMYMMMYQIAVKEASEPDYKKGLTFLIEFRRHRAIEHLAPTDQCVIHIEFVTCYHSLGLVEDAARATIDLQQVTKSLTPADCLQGDLEAAYSWIYNSLFNFKELWTFINPQVVSSGTACAPGLTSIERVHMYQIMSEVMRRGIERYNGLPGFEQMKKIVACPCSSVAPCKLPHIKMQQKENSENKEVIKKLQESLQKKDEELEA